MTAAALTAIPAAGAQVFGTFGPGAWSWFADPRALSVATPIGETFAGWIDWDGRAEVGAIDQAGAVATATVGHLFHDDHGSPALHLEPDGRLTVFFSGHNGRSMYYRTTLAPENVGAWGPAQEVPATLPGRRGFTYPNPVSLGGQLYLFWRGADYSADYAVRSAAGQWSQARRLIVVRGQRPYLKVDGDGRRIALAFTDGHPRERTTSIYYAVISGGWLRHADGRRIAALGGAPIRPPAADLVYDGRTAHVSSWVWDVALGGRHPAIVYATFPSTRRHAYWYARFDGRRWTSHFITFAGPTISPGTIEGQYSGGIALDHADPSVVFLSRKVRGWFEIERWVTRDGGSRWSHSTVVRTPGADDVRPVVPRGPRGPISLLWLQGHYGGYTSYRTAVAYLR